MFEKITNYFDFWALFCAQDEIKNSPIQTQKNFNYTYGSWLTFNRLDECSGIGNEIGDQFEKKIEDYIRYQQDRGISKATIASHCSRLLKIRLFYLNLARPDLPDNFTDRFRILLKTNKISLKALKTRLEDNTALTTLKSWFAGKSLPAVHKHSVVEQIERVLNVEKGTLISSLPTPEVPYDQLINKTDFGKRGSGKLKRKAWKIPAALQQEIEELTIFKTAAIVPTGMQRNGIWTRNSDGSFPSAEIFQSRLSGFLEFCRLGVDNANPLISGMGISENDLTIALLTDEELIIRFVEVFMYKRCGNHYHNGHLNFVQRVKSFLTKDTGYLYQKPEFASKLGLKMTKEEWRRRCIKTREAVDKLGKTIKELCKSGSHEFHMGRDPKEPIAGILNLQQPLRVIAEMLNKMMLDTPRLRYQPLKQAELFRDILLVAFAQSNPLRASMFVKMEFEKNLYRETDGSWWLAFNRRDFKNRAFIEDDYQVMVNPELWEIIERYTKEFRPKFENAQETAAVFIKSKLTKKSNSPNFSVNKLSLLIKRRTAQYIPDSNGFRAHSFRHLFVTDAIRNFGEEGVNIAAAGLNDSPETVRRNYAHLMKWDKFKAVNKFTTGIWAATDLSKNLDAAFRKHQEGYVR